MHLSTKSNQLQEMLAPVVESLGYDFWGLEYVSQGKHSVLRVFIDHENGIQVDDCAKVSRQLSAVLDVEDPISSEYSLEVSSPGMDRPLFTLEQFEKYIGQVVSVKLRFPFEGRRKFMGRLNGVEGSDVVVQVDNHEYCLPIDSIDKANVEPQFK
ncbi:ribosome maturation factor RimP [Litoribrevibacter albus]|uniref:Ribosome maturation factor RimP n=1 Tax=Litoribrevibacter albus TaxID=1473156 RepID=A0AA37W4C5_9GAMM|nr:ribosome maturation factor RimP [Litoribrevibacter albus]